MAHPTRVYVATAYVSDHHKNLEQTLKQAGYSIEVKNLTFTGRFDELELTQETLATAHDVEYLFADPDVAVKMLELSHCPLKWVHFTAAGGDYFIKKTEGWKRLKDLTVTRQFSGLGQQMAEFIIGRIIARERKFDEIYERQKAVKFSFVDEHLMDFRSLDNISICILGVGEIGTKVASLCKAFQMTVWAVVRDERYESRLEQDLELFDNVRPLSKLGEALGACDYVVSILPSTKDTTNLLSGDVLKACEYKKSVFINVGRGDVIDDDSLINALRQGWLGGAILDVYNLEPLPTDSPLWTLPGVTINPHTAALFYNNQSRGTGGFLYNLKCLIEGTPMKGLVDFNKGY